MIADLGKTTLTDSLISMKNLKTFIKFLVNVEKYKISIILKLKFAFILTIQKKLTISAV